MVKVLDHAEMRKEAVRTAEASKAIVLRDVVHPPRDDRAEFDRLVKTVKDQIRGDIYSTAFTKLDL